MKKLMLISSIVLLACSCGAFLENSGVKNYKVKEKIDKTGLNDFQYDFIYLSRLLEKGYPQIDSVFPKDVREKVESEILSSLAGSDIKKGDFVLQTRKYLSHLKNAHTWISLESKNDRVYPFVTFVSNSEWYLINMERSYDSLAIGKKLVRLNDVPMAEVERRLIDFTFAENKISQQHEVSNLQFYNKPNYLREIGVIKEYSDKLNLTFEDGTSLKISAIGIDDDASVFSVAFKPSELTRPQRDTYAYQVYPDDSYAYFQFNRLHDQVDVVDAIGGYVKPWLQPVAKKYVKRQFKKEEPNKRFARYHNAKYPIFQEFARELVDSLNQNNIENLVIDLRYSGGGNLMLGLQLLYFLTEDTNLRGFSDYAYTSEIYKNYFADELAVLKESAKLDYRDNELVLTSGAGDLFDEIMDSTSVYHVSPNRPVFKGKVYVMANYNTASASALLTTLFQDNNLATIIGTSVSNNPIGATTYAPMKLPKTKADVSIATTYMERPDPARGKYLIPDYWVEYQLSDLLNGTDPYLQKVQDMIRQNPSN